MVFLDEKQISKMNFTRLKMYRQSIYQERGKYMDSDGNYQPNINDGDGTDRDNWNRANATLAVVNKYFYAKKGEKKTI